MTTTEPAITRTTEYGVQFPDGKTEWGSVGVLHPTGGTTTASTADVHRQSHTRNALARLLRRNAEACHLPDADEYLRQHKLVTRERTVIVDDPRVVGSVLVELPEGGEL